MADRLPDILLDSPTPSNPNYEKGQQIRDNSQNSFDKVVSMPVPSDIQPVLNLRKLNLDVVKHKSIPKQKSQDNHKKPVRRLPPSTMKIHKISPRPVVDQFPMPSGPESTNDYSPFTTKYQDIIQNYTGKLKFCNDELSYSSFSEEDIDQQGEIGGGVSGTVYIVEHRASKLKMAAKKMKWNPHLEEQKRILMDLKIMSIQKSEYIVFYYGSLVVKDNVWLYMELMDTCLDKILKKYGPLPEDIVGKVAVATLNALHYLKSVHDIIHRDVKPSNILLNKFGHIKICDFGISKQLVESCAATRGAGPTAYISPERLDIDLKEYDVRADVWSLGISVIELLTGKLPYSDSKSDIEVMTRIFQDAPPLLPEYMDVSKECRDFVVECLTKDYKKRPKFQELLEQSEFVNVFQSKAVAVDTWFAALSENRNTALH